MVRVVSCIRMRRFGLIGKTLGHSFSKSYFEAFWKEEGIWDCRYELLELDDLSAVDQLLKGPPLFAGLNVTIPYKMEIISHLDRLTPGSRNVGSVNCMRNVNGIWEGHNTDGPAFRESLVHWLPKAFKGSALILGTGGSSRAVQWALRSLEIPFSLASGSGRGIPYGQLDEQWDPEWRLIVQTTPMGMWPEIERHPAFPFFRLDESFYLFDLIYNPENTLFLTLGARQGAHTKNGLEMLRLQADLSWRFWNE